ncbi:hypothetical protein OIV83_001467 [Microbotryomycetes sp. JL201]|nr:hypothetical protein OIV83_001467 [Microbotryomycetes sp. JL201]
MNLPALLLLVAPAVQAIYFTYPRPDTVWDTPTGKTITWKFQPGDPRVGNIILQSTSDESKFSLNTTVASSVALNNEQLQWPSNLDLSRYSANSYFLRIVNSRNPQDVYTSVGPFTIEDIDGTESIRPTLAAPATTSPSSSSTSSSSSTTSTSTEPVTTTVMSTASTLTVTSGGASFESIITTRITRTASASNSQPTIPQSQSQNPSSGAGANVGQLPTFMSSFTGAASWVCLVACFVILFG